VNDHANVGHAEGNAEKVEGDANVEGNVGHARGMLAMLRGMILMWMLKRKRPPDVQKRQLPDVQKRRLLWENLRLWGKKGGLRMLLGLALVKKEKWVATARRGQDSGLTDVIDEEEL